MENCIIAVAFQRCVSPQEGCEILREIHEGDCGHHAGSKSLVAKAFCHGFYWLMAHADAEDLVRGVMVVRSLHAALMFQLKN